MVQDICLWGTNCCLMAIIIETLSSGDSFSVLGCVYCVVLCVVKMVYIGHTIDNCDCC